MYPVSQCILGHLVKHSGHQCTQQEMYSVVKILNTLAFLVLMSDLMLCSHLNKL